MTACYLQPLAELPPPHPPPGRARTSYLLRPTSYTSALPSSLSLISNAASGLFCLFTTFSSSWPLTFGTSSPNGPAYFFLLRSRNICDPTTPRRTPRGTPTNTEMSALVVPLAAEAATSSSSSSSSPPWPWTSEASAA